jgi:hypothetical protein
MEHRGTALCERADDLKHSNATKTQLSLGWISGIAGAAGKRSRQSHTDQNTRYTHTGPECAATIWKSPATVSADGMAAYGNREKEKPVGDLLDI